MSDFNVYMHVTDEKVGYAYLKSPDDKDDKVFIVPTYRMDFFKMEKGRNKPKMCLSSFEVIRYGIDPLGN